MCIVDPMYQYSLPWFNSLFRGAFKIAAASDQLQQRLSNSMARQKPFFPSLDSSQFPSICSSLPLVFVCSNVAC